MKMTFSHVRVTGIAAVVPEKCINIDDEIGRASCRERVSVVV